jgi:hypothetical protein
LPWPTTGRASRGSSRRSPRTSRSARVVNRLGPTDALEGLTHIDIDELSYRRHHEYIAARLSNDPAEGMNGKVRTITRCSHGLHSTWSLIALIMLCCSGIALTPLRRAPDPSVVAT